MARSFPGGTPGTNTDNLTATVTAIDTGSFSMGCWFNLDAAQNFHRAIQVNTGTADGHQIFHSGSGFTNILFHVQFSTTALQITLSLTTVGATGTWVCAVGAYGDSTTATNSEFWLGNKSLAMAQYSRSNQNGSGTRVTGNTTAVIGNRKTDEQRCWNGDIAQAFYVPWKMTAVEAERFRLGDWTVLYAHGQPRFFLPLTGASVYDLGGSTGNWTIEGTTVVEDPPVSASWSRGLGSILAPVSSAQASSGAAVAVAVGTATAVESRQTSGVVSARVAVVARAAGARQTSGAVLARAAVVATAAESRQTTGAATSPATVVVRTTGTQGGVVGGLARAVVAVTATVAGSRQTSGLVSAAVNVTARAAASRATGGASLATGAAVARTTGAQGAVVGGVVTAGCTVITRTAGKHGGTGVTSAAVNVTARCAAKRATTGAARAAVVSYCLVSAKRATTGASRAVGVVYARTTAGQIVEAEGGYIGGATVKANTMGAAASRANTIGATAGRANRVGGTVLGGDFDG